MSDLSQQDVKSALFYDAETGDFTWKYRLDQSRAWNSRRAGKKAGSTDAHGYVVIILNNVSYKAHRLAWLYVNGRWPSDDIDHINRIRNDNRMINLRECSRSANNLNRDVLSQNESGFTGVSLCKHTSLWRAKLRVDGKQIHLGRFKTPEEASAAYQAAKTEVAL